MISIPQVGSVLCGLVLLLNVSHAAAAAQAPNDLTHNRTIMGDVMRVEYAYYFVKEKGCRAVRLHADKTTVMMGQLKEGNRVGAEVTEQNHALRMRSLPLEQISINWENPRRYTPPQVVTADDCKGAPETRPIFSVPRGFLE